MTNLKTYENFGDNIKDLSPYKKSDYILFFDDNIGELKNGLILNMFVRRSILWYEVANVDGVDIGYHTSILDNDIERLLTLDEISDIKIKNTANKYNL